MPRHEIQWTAPSPLWREITVAAGGPERAVFGAPAILRYATDSFMEEYLNTLATDPRRLGEFRAVPETWRGKVMRVDVPPAQPIFTLPFQRLGLRRRRATLAGQKSAPTDDARELSLLKLYQPAHQRHYLISTCLICQTAGMPDRKVDLGKQEKVSFALRRLFPPLNAKDETFDEKTWEEFAWVATRTGYEWIRVRGEKQPSDRVVLEGEERLPLFPAHCVEDDQRTRRLFAGVIPVARRETYLGAQKRDTPPQQDRPTDTSDFTARKILFRKQVLDPWRSLVEQVGATHRTLNELSPETGAPLPPLQARLSLRSAREEIQVASWLVLLDLAEYLSEQMPEVWKAVVGTKTRDQLETKEQPAFDALKNAVLSEDLRSTVRSEFSKPEAVPPADPESKAIYAEAAVPKSLLDALKKFTPGPRGSEAKTLLERVDQPYERHPDKSRAGWPAFVFPLVDPELPHRALLAASNATNPANDDQRRSLVTAILDSLDRFASVVLGALPEKSAGPEPEIPTAARVPENQAEAVFRIRCVYERPACGPLHDDVVSEATEPFALAAYFDPDAPARPIRIGLPLDTTPAGLRKFDKNTAFIMSDILCGQVQKLKGLGFGDLVRSVLPWPLHKDISVGDMKPCGTGSSGGGFGTICSISIPIITICALILLMIMVNLLNIVFRWLPFFIMCFPIPGLKGKK